MKKSAIIFAVGMLVLSFTIYATAQTGAKGQTSDAKALTWHKYDKALELAKDQNKHVMVFFTTSWCGYCKKMKKTTFTDPKVLALMTGEFVLAVVDGDSKYMLNLTGKDGKPLEMTERQLAQAFGVKGYPTTIFLKPDGTTIAPISGYWAAEQFEIALRFVSTDSYEKMSFKDFAAQKQG